MSIEGLSQPEILPRHRTVLGGKIHRAVVTGADVDYVGSISLDDVLMQAADILPHERVQVVDVDNGSRLETYAIPAPAGSGIVQLNGAAAHLVEPGHRVIVMSYQAVDDREARTWQPRVVQVDGHNRIVDLTRAVQPTPEAVAV